ncbi:hypothetical protein [Pseudonocardia sp. ICBG601]|uniref:phage tail protein n=1 Tax=Pseudonocardia sp. ICBG601 TaxID=2846759 RepID=UPI001CF6DFD6|nr:hypothetical protein [Pseudonocardia sp. ICBG601]
MIALAAFVAAIVWAWNNVDWFREGILNLWAKLQSVGDWISSVFTVAWTGLGDAISWTWNTLIKPVLDLFHDIAIFVGQAIIALAIGPLVLAWKGLGVAFQWCYDTLIKPTFEAFAEMASWLSENALRPACNGIKLAWQLMCTLIQWCYDTIVAPVFRAFAAVGSWLWNNALSPVFDLIKAGWQRMSDMFTSVYGTHLHPLFQAFADRVRWFKDTFTLLVDGIIGVWDRLRDGFKKPVVWVVDTVYNKGIGGLWNQAKAIIPLPDFKPAPTFAVGGAVRGPGSATSDSIIARLSHGEHVLTAREVRAAGGHGAVARWRERLLTGGLPAFATGGPVTWQELSAAIKQGIPRARITDTMRPGAADMHGRGKAIDIAGPRPLDMPFMLSVNRWIASNYPSSYELIHTQPGAVNLKSGRPHTYNPQTRAGHVNHVHWANAGGGLADTVSGWVESGYNWMLDKVRALFDAVTGPLRNSVKSLFGGGELPHLMARGQVDTLFDSTRDKLFGIAGDSGGAPGGDVPGTGVQRWAPLVL